MTSKAAPRRAPAQNDARGFKALIMAASLAITLGGWGALAVGQAQNVSAAPVQPQASVQNSTTTQLSTLPQVNPANLQPRVIARTRSSR